MKVRVHGLLVAHPAGRPVDGDEAPVVASLRIGDLWSLRGHEDAPYRVYSIRLTTDGWQVTLRGVANPSAFIGVDPDTESFRYLRRK